MRVTQLGGCSATSSNVNVTVGTGSAPIPTVSASGSTSFCQGGSVQLTASTGASYLWTNGATTQTITASLNGNYSVSVSQSNGCSAISTPTAVTVNPLATFTITPTGPLSFCTGGSVTFNVTNSTAAWYVWYKNNVVIYSGTNPFYKATSAGVYKMRAQLGTCGAFSNPYTVTTPCREGETLMSDLNLNVYPNPFSDFVKITFELSEEAPVTVKLFDMSGKLIDLILDNSNMMSGESTLDYSTSHLAGGVYILEVASTNATKRIKIVSSR